MEEKKRNTKYFCVKYYDGNTSIEINFGKDNINLNIADSNIHHLNSSGIYKQT